MKKTLVAIAAVVATTGAMADVTISGIIDQSFMQTTAKDSSAGTTARTSVIGGQYTGSDLNIGGSEDLGDGLKASFQFGMSPSPDSDFLNANGDNYPYANYVSFLALSGSFGSIKVGQFWSPLHITSATYDAADYSQVNNNMQVSQGASGTTGGNIGQLIANQIQYTLPTLVEGLTLQVGNAQGETAGSTVGNQSNSGAMYTTGAFSVGYAMSIVETSATTDTTNTSAGVSYNLGVAKLFYSVQTRKLSSATATDQGNQYGVQIPFGAFKVGIQATDYTTPSMAANTGGNGYNILLKYDLSKRTSVIAQTGTTKITGGTNSGDTSSTSAVGLVHFF